MVCFSETNTPDASYEIDRSSTKRLSIKRVA